jgi:hypothetical protein
MPEEGMRHFKLPPGASLSVRDTGAPIRTEDEEIMSPEYIAKGLLDLRESLRDLARQTENHAHPVDEYQTCAIGGTSSISLLTLQPTYEYWPEKIISVLVAGPPAGAITVTLGDRIWPLVIPAAGILPIGPVALMLGRSDARTLSAATPGQYFMELMGFADQRFNA